MGKITVYYDDRDESCGEYIRYFQKYDNVVCKKASEFREQRIIFELEGAVGFVFSGTKEYVPDPILHVMSKVVMDKKARSFVVVSGGRREYGALRMALTELERRGYRIGYCVTPYLLKYRNMDEEKAVEDIVVHINTEEKQVRLGEVDRIYSQRFRRKKRDEIPEV